MIPLHIQRPESFIKWWAQLGLNQRPLRCQRSALPLSYAPHNKYGQKIGFCVYRGIRKSKYF